MHEGIDDCAPKTTVYHLKIRMFLITLLMYVVIHKCEVYS